MTRKKHINKILAPTQSQDNPAILFMFTCFSFPELHELLRCGESWHGEGSTVQRKWCPARPWKSKSPSVSIPVKRSTKQGNARGTQTRYGAELPPVISIARYPGRPVILGMEKGMGRHLPSALPGHGHIARVASFGHLVTWKRVSLPFFWAMIWGGGVQNAWGEEKAPGNAPSRKKFGPLQKSFWCAESWISVQDKQSNDTSGGWKTYQTKGGPKRVSEGVVPFLRVSFPPLKTLTSLN